MQSSAEFHEIALRIRGGNEGLIKTFILVKQGRLEVLEARIVRDGELHEVTMTLTGPEAKVKWFIEKAKGLPYYLEVRKL
ncbi:MAG: hypothetical protein NZ988_00745 [Thaumarchaeota archaeon]|nr:hypothetical protein [Candidatus Calditenuaceae archaeon]MDW8186562.1 hypothetical protein [Nitrososphaerota archaeon]